jgi:hypothetical protein
MKLCSFGDKSIAKEAATSFDGKIQKKQGHLQNIFTMHCIYMPILSGLSLGKASHTLSTTSFIKRNHVSIWNWIQ